MSHRRICLALCLLASGVLFSCSQSTTFDNSSLVVGVECAYAPFNWVETSANDYTLPISNHAGEYADGFDIQVAKQLGKDLNKTVKIVQTEWTSLIPDLEEGGINCIVSGMTDTAERELSISFSDEYYRSELVLVTQASVAEQYTTALTSEEFASFIAGKHLVSQTETVTDDLIDIFVNEYKAVHDTPVTSFPLAATDVKNGSSFAMTAELPVAKAIVASMPELGIVHIDQSILGEDQYQLGVSVGIQKGNDELKNAINTAISGWTDDWKLSTMDAALTRSGGVQ